MTKRSLFVTLADGNYIDQAKQLFSSLYFNAGWKGDYMLLSSNVEEERLQWFRKKGILVKKYQSLYEGYQGGMSQVLTHKFYLFTTEFKKWKVIIYCDGDATIRASLDELESISGFCSALDSGRRLHGQVIKYRSIIERKLDKIKCERLIKEISEKFDLNKRPFCAGFFAFNTDIINGNTFPDLKKTMDKYQIVSEYGDQLSMNLFFYGKWKKLPVVYNFQLKDEINRYHIQPTSVKAIVLHFFEKEPWLTKNYFYKEWKSNLDRAESIDLSDIPEGKKWSKKQLRRYSNYLDIREWVIWYLSLPFRLVIRIMVVLMGYVLIVFKILPKEHLSYLWEASVHMNFKEIKISLINKIFEREARVQVHDGE